MEQTINEQTAVNSQPAEAEQVDKGEGSEAVSLGKFKDVKSLIQAYNSLQAEFTKRCQRIKELEGERVKDDKVQAPSLELSVEKVNTAQGTSEELKNQILKDYLKGVLEFKQKAVIMDEGASVGVKTPKSKPKTIAEAGALAKEILN